MQGKEEIEYKLLNDSFAFFAQNSAPFAEKNKNEKVDNKEKGLVKCFYLTITLVPLFV
jgi:hypothetical protein